MKTRIAVFLVLVTALATAHIDGNKVAYWPFNALRVEEPGYDKALASPEMTREIAETNAQIPSWQTVDSWTACEVQEASNALAKR